MTTDAARRLEALRPRYDALRAERIRAESDVERLADELAAARARARDEFGSDDEEVLARLIAEAEAASARAVEDFAARIDAIEAGLSKLAQES